MKKLLFFVLMSVVFFVLNGCGNQSAPIAGHTFRYVSATLTSEFRFSDESDGCTLTETSFGHTTTQTALVYTYDFQTNSVSIYHDYSEDWSEDQRGTFISYAEYNTFDRTLSFLDPETHNHLFTCKRVK